MSVGSRALVAALSARGLGVRQAARLVDVDPGMFSRWLNGLQRPGAPARVLLAKQFAIAFEAWDESAPEAAGTDAA